MHKKQVVQFNVKWPRCRTKWILAVDQINAGSRIHGEQGARGLNKFLDGRPAIGWWNTLVPSNGEGQPYQPAHSKACALIGRSTRHSPFAQVRLLCAVKMLE